MDRLDELRILHQRYLAFFVGHAICLAVAAASASLRNQPTSHLLCSYLFPDEHQAEWLRSSDRILGIVTDKFRAFAGVFSRKMDELSREISRLVEIALSDVAQTPGEPQRRQEE